jgi:transcriptional regulator with XRE-family HTH domain
MKKHELAMVRLGQELKGRRQEKGVTMEQASRLAQISRSTVQRIEAGDGSVALNTLFAYASSINLQDLLAKAMVGAVREGRRGMLQGLSELEQAKMALDDLAASK